MKKEPKIYVSTYAKYNAGSLLGEWLNLNEFMDEDELFEMMKGVHADEPDPEFMIQDFQGFPKCFWGESMSKKDFKKLYEFLSLLESDQKLLEMYSEATGEKIDGLILSEVCDKFAGIHSSFSEFTEMIAEESIPKDFPSWIVIDWETTWNCNLRYDYVTAENEGEIYFFYNI